MIYTTVFATPLTSYEKPYDSKQSSLPQLYPNWIQISDFKTTLYDISMSDFIVCGTSVSDDPNELDNIYCKDLQANGGEWKMRKDGSKLRKIAIDSGAAVGLNKENQVWFTPDVKDYKTIFVQLGSGFQTIDISNSNIIAIDTNNKLHKGSAGSTTWNQAGDGNYHDAAIYGNRICAISFVNRGLFCTSDITQHPVKWTQLTGAPAFTSIKMSDSRICGLAMPTSNYIICSKFNQDTLEYDDVWQQVHEMVGAFDIEGSNIYKTGKSGKVYTGIFSD
eukprot:NODE_451_length_7265_cov_0.799609.p5 type:complete len:277 gc:universal NODE_451_length_7265_cov_0.799609:5859-6689(+)